MARAQQSRSGAARRAVIRSIADAGIERPTRRSRKTRLALIDAARGLLEERGVGVLTVKAVTDRADVAHGTFYHHFPSTEAVLVAAIVESMREFAQEMERGFADAADKSWVIVASLSSTFRMLAAHAALPWMLERPHVLAEALEEACGPFARHDVEAMVTAGDIPSRVIARAGRYWEWLIIGALFDAAKHPDDRRTIESNLVDLMLRILGLEDARIASLLERLRSSGGGRRTRSATAKA